MVFVRKEKQICAVFYRLFIYVLMLEIQSLRGNGWDPVIKRGWLGSSH